MSKSTRTLVVSLVALAAGVGIAIWGGQPELGGALAVAGVSVAGGVTVKKATAARRKP